MATAAPIARGSCFAGSLSSPARCDPASQPTNENISTLAAPPIASQPFGANGVQFSSLAVRERGDDRDEQQRAQQGGEPELQTSRRMQARGVGRQHDRDHRRRGRDGRTTSRAEQFGDVEATHQRHCRRADHDAAEEPPAGRGAGAAAEGLTGVRRRPARLWLTCTERGKRGRERDRQRQQARPGDDRRRPRLPRGDRRDEQDAGAQHGTDVESDGGARGEHADSFSPIAGHLVLTCAVPATLFGNHLPL